MSFEVILLQQKTTKRAHSAFGQLPRGFGLRDLIEINNVHLSTLDDSNHHEHGLTSVAKELHPEWH
jgi:hypothetical protein